MAKVRLETYSEHAWPRGFGRLYEKNGLVMSLLLAVGMSFFMVLAVALKGSLLHEPLQGDFYAVFSHELMITIFGLTFGFAVFALAKGAISYWRQIQPGAPTVRAAGETSSDVLSLKYLDGGHGKGCNEEDDRFTLWRRRFHHFTFYGFMLCFAATSTGTLYHYLLDWHAPYPFFSLPVLLGTAGGIGLLVGPAGLFYLHTRRHPLHGDSNQKTMDRGFIALLFLTSLTGLLLLLWRDTSFMALLLAIHLGTVLAFFLIMPYCKFAHGFYRSIALYKWSLEKRQD